MPENSIIVYSGSASGEHTPILLKLFPTFKFIMMYDYEYIYKKDVVSKTHKRDIMNFSKCKRGKKLTHMIDMLKVKKCQGKTYNALTEKEFGSLKDFELGNKRVYVYKILLPPT